MVRTASDQVEFAVKQYSKDDELKWVVDTMQEEVCMQILRDSTRPLVDQRFHNIQIILLRPHISSKCVAKSFGSHVTLDSFMVPNASFRHYWAETWLLAIVERDS